MAPNIRSFVQTFGQQMTILHITLYLLSWIIQENVILCIIINVWNNTSETILQYKQQEQNVKGVVLKTLQLIAKYAHTHTHSQSQMLNKNYSFCKNSTLAVDCFDACNQTYYTITFLSKRNKPPISIPIYPQSFEAGKILLLSISPARYNMICFMDTCFVTNSSAERAT